MNLEIELDRALKKRILRIVKMSATGKGHLLEDSDQIILFHWARNMNDPVYDFVPKKYRK